MTTNIVKMFTRGPERACSSLGSFFFFFFFLDVESYTPRCGPAEVNVSDVGEEGDGRQIVHRTGEEVLFAAVLLHQGEGLIRVEEDLIGCYEENARNHALKTDRLDIVSKSKNGQKEERLRGRKLTFRSVTKRQNSLRHGRSAGPAPCVHSGGRANRQRCPSGNGTASTS